MIPTKNKPTITINKDIHSLLKEVSREKEFSIAALAEIIILDWLKDYYKKDPSPNFIEYETNQLLEKLN